MHEKATVEVTLTVRHTNPQGATEIHTYNNVVSDGMDGRPQWVNPIIDAEVAAAVSKIQADFGMDQKPGIEKAS